MKVPMAKPEHTVPSEYPVGDLVSFMPDHPEAVNALKRLGLTEYDAKCLVALTRLPQGTAREISRMAEIPRSRVYDSIDRLEAKGLVEAQDSEPKVFRAVPIDTAIRILEREYESYIDTVEDSLRDVEPTYKEVERGVWALEGHDRVNERTREMVDRADEEIVLFLFEESLLDEQLFARLDEAVDEGLSVLVGTTDGPIHDHIEDTAPSVEQFSTELIDWISGNQDDHAAGRILLVDRQQVLTSSIYGEELPGIPAESAIWSEGVDHGLSILVRHVVLYELEQHRR